MFFFLYVIVVHGESFAKNPDEDKEAKKNEELKAGLARKHLTEITQEVLQEGRILHSEFEEQNAIADDALDVIEESKERVVVEGVLLPEEEKDEMISAISEKLGNLFDAEARARKCLTNLEQVLAHQKFILQNVKEAVQKEYIKMQVRIVENPSLVGYLEWHVNRRQHKLEIDERLIKDVEAKLEKYKKRQDSHEDKNFWVTERLRTLGDLLHEEPEGDTHTEPLVDTPSRLTSWSDFGSLDPFEALSTWTTTSENTTGTNNVLVVEMDVDGQGAGNDEDVFDDMPPLEGDEEEEGVNSGSGTIKESGSSVATSVVSGGNDEDDFNDMSPLEEEEEDAPSTSQHQLPPGNQAATSQGNSVSQPLTGTQEKQEEKEKGSSLQTPTSLKRPRSDSFGDRPSSPGGKRSAMLIPGYSMGSQISSLQGLQCVLLTAVEQVTTSLKVLTLKALNASKNSKSNLSNFQSKKYSEFGKQVSVQKFSTKKPIINRQERDNIANSLSLIHVFATTDSYSMNLESKVRSGQLGIVTNVVLDLFIGLAYDHNNSKSEYVGVMLDSVVGSARAAMNTNALSAILIWNADKTGFTGSIASYYSWGQMKNSRQYIHTEEIVSSKGTPNIMLGGGLIQLGYNFSIFKPVMFTPYVEYLFITTGWKEYDEVTGMLPSHVSSTKDQLVSKSIGIRSCVNLSERSQLQTWVTGTFYQWKIGNITAQPLQSTRPMYKAVVKEYKKKNIQGEVGLSYEVKFTDNVKVGLSEEVQFERTKPLPNCNIRCFFQLRY